MINPYFGAHFFQFFSILVQRIIQFAMGEEITLTTDELQVLVLILISLSGALVGTFLVYRKMTMLANSLSHTILLGIVTAFLLTQTPFEMGSFNVPVMFFASLLTAMLTTFCTHFLVKWVGLQEDASIGIVFTTLFALGIVMVTLFTRNVHIGAEVVMGNVDALHVDDLKLAFAIFVFNLGMILLFIKEYKISTFDPALSAALGISPTLFNALLMIQTSGTVVASFRAVGVLMVLAFITGPILIARFYVHDLRKLLFLSSAIGAGVSLVGVALSRHFLSAYGIPLSTGGLTVTLLTLLFIITLLLHSKKWTQAMIETKSTT